MHAVKTGRTQPWLFIIILLPGIGSIVYFISEILPELWHGRDGQAIRRRLKISPIQNSELRAARRKAKGFRPRQQTTRSPRSFSPQHYAPAIYLYRARH